MWLLALYVSAAADQGVAPAALSGTTQNDIVKEYLSRGTYIFPPGPVAAARAPAAVAAALDRLRAEAGSTANLLAPGGGARGARRAAAGGRAGLPLVVGGIIPPADAEKLLSIGVARVFTPKDFALTGIVDELVTVVRPANGLT